MRLLTPYSLTALKQITRAGISSDDTSEFSGDIPSSIIYADNISWSGDTLTITFTTTSTDNTFTMRRYKSIYLLYQNSMRAIIVEDTLQSIESKVLQIRITFDETEESISIFSSGIAQGPYVNRNNQTYGPITDVIIPDQSEAERINQRPFRKGLIVRNNKSYNEALKYLYVGFGNTIYDVLPRYCNGRPILVINTARGSYRLFLDTHTGFKSSSLPDVEGFTLTEDSSKFIGLINIDTQLDTVNNKTLDLPATVYQDMWEIMRGDNDIFTIGQEVNDYLLATYDNMTSELDHDVHDNNLVNRYIYEDNLVVKLSSDPPKAIMLNKSEGYFRRYSGLFRIFPYQDDVIYGVHDEYDKKWQFVRSLDTLVDKMGNPVFSDINMQEQFTITIFGKNYLVINLDTIVCIDE